MSYHPPNEQRPSCGFGSETPKEIHSVPCRHPRDVEEWSWTLCASASLCFTVLHCGTWISLISPNISKTATDLQWFSPHHLQIPSTCSPKTSSDLPYPRHLVTWGGGLMPAVGSLEPRIREKALYSSDSDPIQKATDLSLPDSFRFQMFSECRSFPMVFSDFPGSQFCIIRSITLKDITVIPLSCGKKTDAVFVVVLVAPARISIWPFGMHLAMCFAMFCFSSRLECCCAGSAHGFTLLWSRCPPRPPRPPRHQAACRMQCLITSARKRSYIKDVTGEDVEIKLVAYDWPSAEFVTSISQILIQEVLGYKAKIHTTRPFSVLEAILSLTGCNDMTCDRTAGVAGHVAHVAHVVLESWLGAYGGDYEAFGQRHPDKVPADLGSMGYAGEEAMFHKSMGGEAYEDSGHSLGLVQKLQRFQAVNTIHQKGRGLKNDWVSPAPLWYLLKHIFCFDPFCHARYFSSLEDLPISDFSFCNEQLRCVEWWFWMACWRCRTDITPSARPSIVSG